MIGSNAKKQSGFTLLELIVVIGLLGLVTSLASDFVINETNQQRFETTKQRMGQIRYAIIGDSSRSLNGQPTISGFIADTGRLPASIQNLMSNVAYCLDDSSATTKAACDMASANWSPEKCSDSSAATETACNNVTSATWSSEKCSTDSATTETACNSINSATWSFDPKWKGPYLTPTGNQSCNNTKVASFRDSWGNKGNSNPTGNGSDCANFGWTFEISDKNLTVYSLGLDGEEDTGTTNELYEEDYKLYPDGKLIYSTEIDQLKTLITPQE